MSDQELALESTGCLVSYSSCGHEDVAASKNIIDGSRGTFWATTGLYPHSFIITFPKTITLNSITIRSYCVRSMLIEKCSGDLSSGFETLQNLDILLTDLHHQVTKVDLDATTAKHLRFTIKNGFQEFCAIYKNIFWSKKPAGRSLRQAFMISGETSFPPNLLFHTDSVTNMILIMTPHRDIFATMYKFYKRFVVILVL
ncbi:intraflagellar transport protein 25 homolog isoform X3 [Frankliniella occidentalis]|uniref:Intraflagellar transport protein 25 homolog isoform X3 n=1 Tax=Frankliniella occidentalis TaxID=133901 RepID=A0A9C6UBS2_FRAOC|nr:intraflagellar transport protein 25 homolog isoform X3 [Frankliniella occidentalis]